METVGLIDALVNAYRPQVLRRLADHGIDAPQGMAEALDDGERWLRRELERLLDASLASQRRGPMEVFQEAMRFPTTVLTEAGVPEVVRDPAVSAALPGDRFHLAPASSSELGELAWRAHLAWGVEKARTVARPTVGLLSSDLMDVARIEGMAAEAGFRVEAWRTMSQLADRRPVVAFVDLTHAEAEGAIRSLAGAGVRVFGFGPHVDDLAMMRARALGAADALARSRFFSVIPELLPTLT